MVYSNINLSALEGALKEAANKMIAQDNGDLDSPIGRLSTNYIANTFGMILGIEPQTNDFCWQAKVLCDFYTSTLKIGLTEINITKGKSINTVIGEILAAVIDELHSKAYESTYYSIDDEGFGVYYNPKENILDEMSIHELIAYLNEDRYCDDKFVEWIRSQGFEVKTGKHPDIGDTLYIDVSRYGEGAKIWLHEANRQHTIYRRIDMRSRLEVLFLLNEMRFGCAWSDEN